MTKQALKLALAALGNSWTEPGNLQYEIEQEAITAIKEAIAELESQEPVAWRAPNWSNLHREYGYRDFDDPVIDISNGKPSPYNEPLYTHPPQRTEPVAEDSSVAQKRTWVGLTDEEVEKLDCVQVIWQDEGEVEICGVKEFYRNIEAKLKEKNT